MNGFEPEEYLRKKRLIILSLGILFIIQLVVLIAYVFKEKQTVLAVPMILGLIINAFSIINLWQLGK